MTRILCFACLPLTLSHLASGGQVFLSNADLATHVEVSSLNPDDFAFDGATTILSPSPFTQASSTHQVNGGIDVFGFAYASGAFAGTLPELGAAPSTITVGASALASAQAQVEFVNPFQSQAHASAALNYTVGVQFDEPTVVTYSATLLNATFQFFDYDPNGLSGQHVSLVFQSFFDPQPLIVQPDSIEVPAGQYIVKYGMSAVASAVGTDGPFPFTQSASLNAGIGFTPVPAPSAALVLLMPLALARRRR